MERVQDVLPAVTKTKIGKLKLALPGGWVEKPSDAEDNKMIMAKLEHPGIGGQLVIFKWPTFLSFVDEEIALKNAIDEGMPGNELVVGCMKFKRGMNPPRICGYHSTYIQEGQEKTLVAYTASRVQKGFKKYGLAFFAVPAANLTELAEEIEEDTGEGVTFLPLEAQFVAILNSI